MNEFKLTVKRLQRNVFEVRFDIPSVADGWEQWVLCRSDAHHDNPHCDRKMEMRHLRQAVMRGAGVISNGDDLCLMQSKHDPRRSKGMTIPSQEVPHYIDKVIEETADDYAETAAGVPFWIKGHGNHETAVVRNCSTDPSARLMERLRTMTGNPNLHQGWYCGRVRFDSC